MIPQPRMSLIRRAVAVLSVSALLAVVLPAVAFAENEPEPPATVELTSDTVVDQTPTESDTTPTEPDDAPDHSAESLAGESDTDQPDQTSDDPPADVDAATAAVDRPDEALRSSSGGFTPFADPTLSLTLAQSSGAEPFDADDAPGHDSGPGNTIIRTNDTVTYNLGIRYEGQAQTNPTITFELPRGQVLLQLPPYCRPGSSVTPAVLPDPAVPLTPTSWLSLPRQTVTCIVGDENPGTSLNYEFVSQVRSEVPHGTLLDQIQVEVVSDQVTTPATINADRLRVSAAARYDLSKRALSTDPDRGPMSPGETNCPAPHESEQCMQFTYPVSIHVPAGGRGSTPLQDGITFTENLDPVSFFGPAVWADMVAATGSVNAAKAAYGPVIKACTNISLAPGLRESLPYSAISLGDYANATNSARDSGTISCPAGDRGDASTVTITGTDTSATTVPTTTGSGNAIEANVGYVATFHMVVSFPKSAVTEFGESNGDRFTLRTCNQYTNVRMTSLDGQPVSDLNPDNNERCATAAVDLGFYGGLDKNFTGIPGEAPDNTPAADFMPGGSARLPGPPGSGLIGDGNTVVMTGQGVYSLLSMSAKGPRETLPRTVVTCDAWDADRLALAAHPDWNGHDPALYPGNNRPVFPVFITGGHEGHGLIRIEYSSGPAGPGADSECAGGFWSANPNAVATPSIDERGRTVWQGINRVRVTWVVDYPPGLDFANPAIEMAIGQVVLEGDVSEPIGNWASQIHAPGDRTAAQVYNDPNATRRTSDYNPTTHAGAEGDRLWQGDARVRVRKFVQNPGTGEYVDAAVPQYTAGQIVRYRINPSLTGDVTVPGMSRGVTIEDCLPRWQILQEATQGGSSLEPSTIQMGAPAGAEIECPANQQYVKWDLGNREVGVPIEPIVIEAEILEVALNGVYSNHVVAASPADGSPVAVRSDDVQMQLVVPTGIKIAKTVDKPVIEVNPQDVTNPRQILWSVMFANIDGPPNVANVDVIDLLPANGLRANDYAGSLVFESATPVAGENIQVLYTKGDPASLAVNPEHSTNLVTGSTVWCDAVTGGTIVSGVGDAATDCPAANTEVTGLRFLRPGEFNPGDDFQVDILMTPVGNAAGDHYRNITAGKADGVSQGVGPALRNVDVVGSSLGDRVWEDLNGDGIQDPGEPGIADWPVTLTGTDVDGNAVTRETTTNADGEYQFAGLASGQYRITFENAVMPLDHTWTTQGVGDDVEADSDVNPATGQTVMITLDRDSEDLSWDAGIQIDRDTSIAMDKTLVDATELDDENRAVITYDITVTNTGTAGRRYNLHDTLMFGDGIAVLSASVENTDPGDIETNELFDGLDDPLVVEDQAIEGDTVHVYRVTVEAEVSPTITDEARDCELASHELGTGYLNSATLNSDTDEITDVACAEVPEFPLPPSPPEEPTSNNVPDDDPKNGVLPQTGGPGLWILLSGLTAVGLGALFLRRRNEEEEAEVTQA